MLEELEQVLPGDIEKRSFEIITEELGKEPLILWKNPLSRDAFIPVRISTMRISFTSHPVR